MKFRLHTIGLFIATASVCLTSVMMLVGIATRLFAVKLDAALFLMAVPVFYLSWLGTERLYARHCRLCCPDCGRKLAMDYHPGVVVAYSCSACGFSCYTRMTVGGAGRWP